MAWLFQFLAGWWIWGQEQPTTLTWERWRFCAIVLGDLERSSHPKVHPYSLCFTTMATEAKKFAISIKLEERLSQNQSATTNVKSTNNNNGTLVFDPSNNCHLNKIKSNLSCHVSESHRDTKNCPKSNPANTSTTTNNNNNNICSTSSDTNKTSSSYANSDDLDGKSSPSPTSTEGVNIVNSNNNNNNNTKTNCKKKLPSFNDLLWCPDVDGDVMTHQGLGGAMVSDWVHFSVIQVPSIKAVWSWPNVTLTPK